MAAVDTPTRPATPAGPPPRTVWLIGGLIVLAIVVLAAVSIAVWQLTQGRSDDRAPDGTRGATHTVTGRVDGRDEATLELLTGATSVTVRGADLGDILFRADMASSADTASSVDIERGNGLSAGDDDGHVRIRADGGNAEITIQLNRDVRWTIRFTAGSTSNTADLAELHKLAAVEYIGGVSAIDLRLPTPAGTVPVRMNGGANSFRIHAPAGVPVRVRAGGGAGSVTIDGSPNNGVSAGASFSSAGWDTATDRYDVDNTAGVSSVVVERR